MNPSETLDDAIRKIHEKRSVQLRRHELLTLARLADEESTRFAKRAQSKRANPYSRVSNLQSAGSYKRIADEIRRQITDEKPTATDRKTETDR